MRRGPRARTCKHKDVGGIAAAATVAAEHDDCYRCSHLPRRTHAGFRAYVRKNGIHAKCRGVLTDASD